MSYIVGSMCLYLLEFWEALKASGIRVIDHEMSKRSKKHVAMNTAQGLLLRYFNFIGDMETDPAVTKLIMWLLLLKVL